MWAIYQALLRQHFLNQFSEDGIAGFSAALDAAAYSVRAAD